MSNMPWLNLVHMHHPIQLAVVAVDLPIHSGAHGRGTMRTLLQ
jgi:hypothetical protein